MANQYLRSYMDALLSLEQEFDLEAVSQMIEQLKKARAERRRIFVFGNGGSASHANHIACGEERDPWRKWTFSDPVDL